MSGEKAAGGEPGDGVVEDPDAEALGVDDISPEHVALAAEIRRLGDAMLGRSVDPETKAELAAQLAEINDRLEQRPRVSKVESTFRHNRFRTFQQTGQWPPPPPNGSRIDFDPASLVGGELNPLGMGARYYREGDEAVGFVNLGTCFEGPPERVHGGVICALFDEVMGSVFRATGAASSFTGELTVRLEAPAPLNTELEFRARQVDAKGRRRMLEAEARSPEGQFASATGIFIEMKAEQLPVISD